MEANGRMIGEEQIVNKCLRKWSFLNLTTYSAIFLEGLRKTMKYRSQHNQYVGRGLSEGANRSPEADFRFKNSPLDHRSR
jgi:hypothetical protein